MMLLGTLVSVLSQGWGVIEPAVVSVAALISTWTAVP